MLGFKVIYDYDDSITTSEVYAIDTTRDRFLIVNKNGWFEWVNTRDCRVKEE